LVTTSLQQLSNLGFHQALIQKQDDIEPYLNTAWTVRLLRGVALFVVVLVVSPFIARFFTEPRAELVTIVLGVSVLLTGLTNIGVVYFKKELEYKQFVLYNTGGSLVNFFVAVLLAVTLENVWALVYGYIAGNVVKVVLSHLVHPYTPSLALDIEKLRELFNFGRWILADSAVNLVTTQADDAIVGRMFGADALGFYQMAYRIANLPVTEVSHVVSSVALPTYSKLQDRPEELRRGFRKVVDYTTLLTFPIAGGIFIIAPEFVSLVLGSDWTPIIPLMRALCALAAVRSIVANFGSLYQATDNPDVMFRLTALFTTTKYVTMLAILAFWINELLVVPLVIGFNAVISLPAYLFIVYKITGIKIFSILRTIATQMLATTLMIAGVYAVKKQGVGGGSYLELTSLILLGILLYTIVVLAIDRDKLYNIREDVVEAKA
jgi:O-antigen/teichoic acid export membrane protein